MTRPVYLYSPASGVITEDGRFLTFVKDQAEAQQVAEDNLATLQVVEEGVRIRLNTGTKDWDILVDGAYHASAPTSGEAIQMKRTLEHRLGAPSERKYERRARVQEAW